MKQANLYIRALNYSFRAALLIPLMFISFFLLPEVESFGQKAVLEKNESILSEGKTDRVYYQSITFNGIPKVSSPLKVKISDTDLDATYGKDYVFLPSLDTADRSITPEKNIITIGIVIKADPYDEEGKERFILSFIYDSLGKQQTLLDTITILDVNYSNPFLADTSKMKLRIVTGSNFDFFDTPIFKNFAGDLHLSLPNLFNPIRKSATKGLLSRRVGLDFGIYNYRYYDADSSGSTTITENYLTDASLTRVAIDTTKYIRDVYSLNSRVSHNNWGFYIGPMIQLSGTKLYDMFLEIRGEGVWRTDILTYSQVPIRNDTLTITQNDVATKGAFQNYKGIRSQYSKTSYFDYYFGLALPITTNFSKSIEAYFYPSIGFSSFQKTVVSTFDEANIRRRTFENKTYLQPYSLIKFQLTTTVAPIDVSMGGELRTIGKKGSSWAVYIGASLSLDKLKR